MTKLGNQTPTQSVILPYNATLFDQAIELYEKSKRVALEWQKSLMKHILSINSEGLWVHTKFGYSLPRRNGKNEVVLIRELYGLINGEQILHTAHRTTTSHSAWEKLKRVIELSEYKDGEDYTTLKATGRERIEFVKTGGRIEFRTRTSTGGLGEGFDLLVIDEAQEYTDDQESALKYVVTSSKNPQTLLCGTPPTLISSGTVFANFRKKALEGSVRNAGWAEWGIENESDCQDVSLWYLTNPSLGTIFTERSVVDELGEDVIDFNIQRLGLWIKYNQKSAITKSEWNNLAISSIPNFQGKLHIGIKYGKDGKNVAMSIAVKTQDEKVFVEVIDCQSIKNSNMWIINFIKNVNYASIVIDGAGHQDILKENLKEFEIKNTLLPTVKEIIIANSKFEQAIFEKKLCHNNQPSLVELVSNCEKRAIGTQGGFGYKSQYQDKDIILLDSVILAYWSCAEFKQKKKQKIYY